MQLLLRVLFSCGRLSGLGEQASRYEAAHKRRHSNCESNPKLCLSTNIKRRTVGNALGQLSIWCELGLCTTKGRCEQQQPLVGNNT